MTPMIPSDVTPFTIAVSPQQQQNLKEKLATATFPDELDYAGWQLGSPLADVKRLAASWRDEYDWTSAQNRLNELPHYRTPVLVDGFGDVGLHFIWERSGSEKAIPLLFIHGWPGSFIEVTKILPVLKKSGRDGDKGPVFDIVAPSLPNYGFSDGIKKKGFGLPKYAEALDKLMTKLGYEEYVTQGGDWGSIISRTLSFCYPQRVKAIHINMALCGPPGLTAHPLLALAHLTTPYTEFEKRGLARSMRFRDWEMGYNNEQSTKPQTIGYALQDSPVAMLAWIYEKLHDWTDAYPWTDEEILTWMSIYWFATAGPAASVRIYYENNYRNRNPQEFGDKVPLGTSLMSYIPQVKLGVARFPQELANLPGSWIRTMGPLVHESLHESGGHFAAWERPEELAKEIKMMYGRGGGAAGVVKGRSGYLDEQARL